MAGGDCTLFICLAVTLPQFTGLNPGRASCDSIPAASRHDVVLRDHAKTQIFGFQQLHLACGHDCFSQVNEALSDEARESKSVGQLKDQLTDIQAEVEAASTRLALTKARVSQNLQRVNQLKAEAVRSNCIPSSDSPEAVILFHLKLHFF